MGQAARPKCRRVQNEHALLQCVQPVAVIQLRVPNIVAVSNPLHVPELVGVFDQDCCVPVGCRT